MSAAEPLFIPRKVWTRAEVERLSLDGLSLELVNGELIDRMGKKPPHVYWKGELRDWLIANFGGECVRSEDPIDVAPEDNPTSEPEPDLMVTYQSRRELRNSNPKPEDLRLVVEISDSTYDFDMKVKAALYARGGIREYWVVDVRVPDAPRLIVHLDPKDGQYSSFAYPHDEDVTVMQGLTLCLKHLM
ncbi:MAG: Uma2 family endonuclease [Bryobacteraceae bacterium]